MTMINPELTELFDFKLMMDHKRSVVKISLFIGIPLVSAMAIKNLITGDHFMAFTTCTMLLILILLGFVIMRRFEEKSEYKIYSVLLRLFNTLVGVSLLYDIGFQSNFSRIEWCYIYPVLVFFAVGVKEGAIWVSIFYGILAFLILNFDLQGITLFQIQGLRSRFLVSFLAVCMLSLFLKRGFRRIQRKLLHHRILKESENRYRQAYEQLNTEMQERKRAEEALLHAAQEWRTTFDGISDIVCLLDPEGRILRCNKSMVNLFGKPFSEIIGRPHWEIIHSTTEPIRGCPVERMRETRRRETTTLPIGDRWFDIAVDPLLDEAGRLIGAVHIMSDVTERKRAEEQRTALEEQLRQSQKMEAIGKLAGGVAHDFNNLLTVIHGYSKLMLNSLDQNSRFRQDVQEILNASERASSLTRQLLAFSRRQVLQPTVLDLNAHVSNMDKMLRRVIGEDIKLVTLLANDLGRIKVDPGQIEQVILNLAINARDAMPNGGKLTIETANAKLDESYGRSHIGVTPGHYVMLSVSDTGSGMTPEIKERIFEPFFTTKEEGKGTGLGLSTVYGIIQQSGGNVWVCSEPGVGTTFTIYLPTIEEGAELLRPTPVPSKPTKGFETILLVEDEEMVRKLACTVLQKNGYTVLGAPNGEEALRIVQGQNGNPIHLMVTDVVMPGMSGRQLAERLVSLQPMMKVLYMSGYSDDAIVHHGVLDPGIAYIQKPFTPDAIVRKVREVLDRG